MAQSCPTCNTSFSRAEHLIRHLRIHESDETFPCSDCGKAFSRVDALKRHQRTCTLREEGNTLLSCNLRRACIPCNTRKVRCNGATPCSQCSTAGLTCRRMPRKRRKLVAAIHQDNIRHAEQNIESGQNQETGNYEQQIQHVYPDRNEDYRKLRGSDNIQDGFRGDRAAEINEQSDATSNMSSPVSSIRNCSPSSGGPSVATNSTGRSFGISRGVADVRNLGTPQQTSLPPISAAFLSRPGLEIIGSSLNWLSFADVSEVPSLERSWNAPSADDAASLTMPLDSARPVSLDPDEQTESDYLGALIASMGRAPHDHLNTENVTVAVADRSHSGWLYINGNGYRCHAGEKYAKIMEKFLSAHAKDPGISTSTLPGLTWLEALEQDLERNEPIDEAKHSISDATYGEIVDHILERIPFKQMYTDTIRMTDGIPSKTLFPKLIQAYFDKFHPVYPFLDPPMLAIPRLGWCLCIATAAIGATQLHNTHGKQCAEYLTCLLREILVKHTEVDGLPESLIISQARLLNAVSLLNSSRPYLVDCGRAALREASSACSMSGYFDELEDSHTESDNTCNQTAWLAWRCREARRRTAMFCWVSACKEMRFSLAKISPQMLDTSVSLISRTRPLLDLQIIDLRVSCAERLWQAKSWHEWHQLQSRSSSIRCHDDCFREDSQHRPSVRIVQQTLSRQLGGIEGMSPLTCTLLIFVLLRYSSDALTCSDNPFLAQEQAVKTVLPPLASNRGFRSTYMASYPELPSWRNRACDMLDVIHWEQVAQSIRTGGLEGPVHLNLHLARILLLTPTNELLSLPRLLHDDSFPSHITNLPSRPSKEVCDHEVNFWVTKDQFKARLAVIHAGATFWHVRRFPSASYTQGFAIFLATLTLWAYATYAKDGYANDDLCSTRSDNVSATDPTQSREESSTPPSYHDTNMHDFAANRAAPSKQSHRMPKVILIDRPLDDELVQWFVRKGSKVSMVGSEDLSASSGRRQLLEDAIELLEDENRVWPSAGSYIEALELMKAKA